MTATSSRVRLNVASCVMAQAGIFVVSWVSVLITVDRLGMQFYLLYRQKQKVAVVFDFGRAGGDGLMLVVGSTCQDSKRSQPIEGVFDVSRGITVSCEKSPVGMF